jgi:peptidoglycan hydrolase-like protein with peptidoglycan-binding domain
MGAVRDLRGRGDGIGKAGIGNERSGSLAPGKRTLTEALPVQAKRSVDAPANEVAARAPADAVLDGEDDDAGSTSHRSQRFDDDPDLAAVTAGTRQLAKGDRGPAVRKIQLALRDMGYLTNVNGVFDERTEEQVKALQRSGGVFDDGKVNRATMAIFERRFTMRTPYVAAAREEAPNLHLDKASGWDDTPNTHRGAPGAEPKGWDAAHPPSALTRHTHTLSDAEKADALATLSPAPRSPSPYGGPGYKAALDPIMRRIVREEAAAAHDKARAHQDPKKLFSLDIAAHIGKQSKQAVDGVYGHWAAHKEFVPGATLQDKFEVESAKIDGMTHDERLQLARDRLDYLWRTRDAVARRRAGGHRQRARCRHPGLPRGPAPDPADMAGVEPPGRGVRAAVQGQERGRQPQAALAHLRDLGPRVPPHPGQPRVAHLPEPRTRPGQDQGPHPRRGRDRVPDPQRARRGQPSGARAAEGSRGR